MQPLNNGAPSTGINSNPADTSQKTTFNGHTFEIPKNRSNRFFEMLKNIFISIAQAFSKIANKIFSATKKDDDAKIGEKTPSEGEQAPQEAPTPKGPQEQQKQNPKVDEPIPAPPQPAPSSPPSSKNIPPEPQKVPTEAPKKEEKPQAANILKVGIENIQNKRVLHIPNFEQVMVMNQNESGQARGSFLCGMHAFKNAIIGLGLDKGIGGFSEAQFNSTTNFNEFYAFASKLTPQDDINISNLALVQKELVKAKPEELTPFLRQLQTVLLECSDAITFLNPIAIGDFRVLPSFGFGFAGERSEEEFFTAGIEFNTLQFLSNLNDVVKKPGPLTHAFLVGSTAYTGHWISFTMRKDAQGNYSWYGYDSYSNQTKEFAKRIEIIEKMLKNPDVYMREAYQSAFGDDFRNKVQNLSYEGDITDRMILERGIGYHSYRIALSFKNVKVENLERIKLAYNFMRKLEWFDSQDPDIREHVANLKKMAKFYRRETLKELAVQTAINSEINKYKDCGLTTIIKQISAAYNEWPEAKMKEVVEDLYTKAYLKAPERSGTRTSIDRNKKLARLKTQKTAIREEIETALKYFCASILEKLKEAVYESRKMEFHDLPEDQIRERITSFPANETLDLLNRLI